MKDKKRKYILMIILLGVLMLLSGCVRKECEEKVNGQIHTHYALLKLLE